MKSSWTDHAALLGGLPNDRQETATVLSRFGRQRGAGRWKCHEYLKSTESRQDPLDFDGDGLIRGHGGLTISNARAKNMSAVLATNASWATVPSFNMP